MPDPLDDTDKFGLATLARRWTPKGMIRTVEGKRLMEGLADAMADSLNIVIDGEQYLPIIWNPSRCLDVDIDKVLQLNGIDVDPRLVTPDKQRRLAILGPELRSWRGAFRSHRAVSGALTGGPTVIRSWIIQRAIVDETDFDLILLDDDDRDTTQIFVLGQGPQGQEFIEGELSQFLDELAKPVLDDIDLVPCFALTAWRDGLAGWNALGDVELVTSSMVGEYESVDMGPDVDSVTAIHALRAPSLSPAFVSGGNGDPYQTLWSTVWFKNTNTDVSGYWEHSMFAGESVSDDRYTVRVYPFKVEFVRYVGGTPTVFGTHPLTHVTGLEGDYQRLDYQVRKTVGGLTRSRAYVNMDPSPWFEEPAGTKPSGQRLSISLDTSSTYTEGRLKIGAITASQTEG